MSILLSLLIFMSPVWTLKLKAIEVPKSTQTRLKLKKSLDNRYVVLTFKETKDLILFRDGALAEAKGFTASRALNKAYTDQIDVLSLALKSRKDQIVILKDQVELLKASVDGKDPDSFTVGAIIFGAAVLGYITYDIAVGD